MDREKIQKELKKSDLEKTSLVKNDRFILEEDYNEDPYDVDIKSIATELEEILPPNLISVLKRLCYEIGVVGLSETEACLITNFNHEKLVELKKKEPLVGRLIDMKVLEYDRSILKNISLKAKKDDKLGQWILSGRNPGKYNQKKGVGGSSKTVDDESMLEEAVKFVQENNEKIIDSKNGVNVSIHKDSRILKKLNLNDLLI